MFETRMIAATSATVSKRSYVNGGHLLICHNLHKFNMSPNQLQASPVRSRGPCVARRGTVTTPHRSLQSSRMTTFGTVGRITEMVFAGIFRSSQAPQTGAARLGDEPQVGVGDRPAGERRHRGAGGQVRPER